MKGMIYKVPIKHKEETPTQALTKDIQNNLSVIKDDIVASSQENVINGENLDDFIYHHFLNRIDPVEYCENVLRHHLPESRQKLHENQTALIRAVCNPKLKQVAGMMSRQCLLRGTIIYTRDGKLIPIEEYKDAWKTNDNASIFEIYICLMFFYIMKIIHKLNINVCITSISYNFHHSSLFI